MSEELLKQLEDRRNTLIADREAYVHQANQRIGELTGRIAELSDLLALLNGLEGGDDADALAEPVPAPGAG